MVLHGIRLRKRELLNPEELLLGTESLVILTNDRAAAI
jgi:hypothetical protein